MRLTHRFGCVVYVVLVSCTVFLSCMLVLSSESVNALFVLYMFSLVGKKIKILYS